MSRPNQRKSTEINGNQRYNRRNELEGTDQSWRLETESTIECFSNNLISTTYVPNQEHVIENLTTTEHSTEEVSNLTHLIVLPTLLVALIREQAAEIENLKVRNSDLATANASLQTQKSCEESCQAREGLEKILSGTFESLLNQLNEKTQRLSDAEKTIQQMSFENASLRSELTGVGNNKADEEQKNRELSDENFSLRQEVSNLELMISDQKATVSDLRNKLDEKELTCQNKTNQLSELEQKILELEEKINQNESPSEEKSVMRRVMSYLR